MFFDIIGPFTDNEWRHYRHNIFNQFTSTETFFEYENWVELLNLLNNQKSKEPPKETKLDQYWIATTEAFCYVFCAIDDVKTFKKMAQSIFDSIIGPFRRQTFEKDAKHILERYQPLQIFYHYDNWKELLILMGAFNDVAVDEKQDGSYFVIKINNYRYEIFKGTKEAALEKCQILKCLNGINDECILLQSCEALNYQQALDNLLMYRYHALKQNIPLYKTSAENHGACLHG